MRVYTHFMESSRLILCILDNHKVKILFRISKQILKTCAVNVVLLYNCETRKRLDYNYFRYTFSAKYHHHASFNSLMGI